MSVPTFERREQQQQLLDDSWNLLEHIWLSIKSEPLQRLLAEQEINTGLSDLESLQSYWRLYEEMIRQQTPNILFDKATIGETWLRDLKEMELDLKIMAENQKVLNNYSVKGALTLLDVFALALHSYKLENPEINLQGLEEKQEIDYLMQLMLLYIFICMITASARLSHSLILTQF